RVAGNTEHFFRVGVVRLLRGLRDGRRGEPEERDECAPGDARGDHRRISVRGSTPSSSPFITGCWLPPTARDLRVTSRATYSYSSCSDTMPSRLRSASPARPRVR